MHVQLEDKELSGILKRHASWLASQVNAEVVGFGSATGGFSKDWEIGEAQVKITIEKK